MIRQTPTLTRCFSCEKRMAAVRGPFSQSIGRAKPPVGHKLGYIMEQRDRQVPICAECVALILRTRTLLLAERTNGPNLPGAD